MCGGSLRHAPPPNLDPMEAPRKTLGLELHKDLGTVQPMLQVEDVRSQGRGGSGAVGALPDAGL